MVVEGGDREVLRKVDTAVVGYIFFVLLRSYCCRIMKEKLVLLILLFVPALILTAQSKQQAKLLQKAYKENSTEMLFEFFDNWANEVPSNEKKAKDPYVKESHKVFAAFYQPMQMVKRGKRQTMYDDKPYYIVQSSLWRIGKAETILYKQKEIDSFWIARCLPVYADDTAYQRKWLENLPPDAWSDFWFNFYNDWGMNSIYVPNVVVESDVEFRPPVHIEGKKVVYLTKKYKKLLDAFLEDDHVDLGEYNIMQPAYSKGDSRAKQQFLDSAAHIYYGHWGGYWQYETYPEAEQIIFNPEMNRAVVLFRFVYEGGQVILEKQNGEWTVVDTRFIWIE